MDGFPSQDGRRQKVQRSRSYRLESLTPSGNLSGKVSSKKGVNDRRKSGLKNLNSNWWQALKQGYAIPSGLFYMALMQMSVSWERDGERERESLRQDLRNMCSLCEKGWEDKGEEEVQISNCNSTTER